MHSTEIVMRNIVFLSILLLCVGCSGNNENEISASGTIEATEVTISAKVGGEILRIPADEGAKVQPGDTLAVIDKADLEIQFEQARANTAMAEAQYKLTVLGARDEDITQAEATLKNAEDDLNRTEGLFKEGSISQKQLDDIRTRYIIAKQTYDKLKSGLRPEEIEAARGKRDMALAQQKSIKKKIDDSYVTAPVAGVLTQKGIEKGEVVLPNASLFRISNLDKVYLMIYISEIELAKIKLGQNASVHIDGVPERAFPGKVIYTSSIAEFTPKNVQTRDDRTKLVFGVKIEIPNPEQILKPGMPADAIIDVSGIGK
jgi:HlyD family secretion protein